MRLLRFYLVNRRLILLGAPLIIILLLLRQHSLAQDTLPIQPAHSKSKILRPFTPKTEKPPAPPLFDAEKDNGIFVDEPKIYDDASLAQLFSQAQTALNQLTAFDSNTLLKGIGTTQGATATQAQTSIQAQLMSILGTPSPGTTINPVNPSLPQQSTPSMPSAFSNSSIDLLNEETQLNFQIDNLSLLLQGALSDQITPGTNVPKNRITLGFPISVNVPPGFEYQHAVAEVEVSVCEETSENEQAPSVVVLLPQAKTYNVASIVNKGTQIGVGAVANVLNIGGNFLRGKQTYYLVQDQDTLAVQRNSKKTSCDQNPSYAGPTFAWQFKPVLGQRVVRDGLRQTFVQLSFSASDSPARRPVVIVRTGWRKYDSRTGRVGNPISPFIERPAKAFAPYGPPSPNGVDAVDNADGTLTVEALGAFKAGTVVQIGNTVIDPSANTPLTSTAAFAQRFRSTKFTASASDIAIKGARLVARDGSECRIVVPESQTKDSPCALSGVKSQPDTASNTPIDQTDAVKHDLKVASTEAGRPSSPAAPAVTQPQQTKQNTSASKSTGGKATQPSLSTILTQFSSIQANQVDLFRKSFDTGYIPPIAGPWSLTVVPFDDSSSLINLKNSKDFDPLPDFGPLHKPVVLIGSKLFGLKDSPYRDFAGNYSQISLVVPNDLLQSAPVVRIRTLFKDSDIEADLPIRHLLDDATHPSGAVRPSSLPLGATNPPPPLANITNVKYLFTRAVDEKSKTNFYAVVGSHLDHLHFVSPAPNNPEWESDTGTEPTLKIFGIPDSLTTPQKVVFRDGDTSTGPLLVLDLPPLPTTPSTAGAAATQSVALQTTPAKGLTKLTLIGTSLEKVIAIKLLNNPLVFAPPAKAKKDPKTNPNGDKKTIDVTLPSPLASPGITLVVVWSDKTLNPVAVPLAGK